MGVRQLEWRVVYAPGNPGMLIECLERAKSGWVSGFNLDNFKIFFAIW